jgi:septin family protein
MFFVEKKLSVLNVQVTHDVHYENFRSQRLSKGGAHSGPGKTAAAATLSDKDVKDKMLAEKDEELRRMQVSKIFCSAVT